jgi:Trp operon repressor
MTKNKTETHYVDLALFKQKQSNKKSNQTYQDYLSLLETAQLENEISNLLTNWDQHDVGTKSLTKGQMILNELSNRSTDQNLKNKINKMTFDLGQSI